MLRRHIGSARGPPRRTPLESPQRISLWLRASGGPTTRSNLRTAVDGGKLRLFALSTVVDTTGHFLRRVPRPATTTRPCHRFSRVWTTPASPSGRASRSEGCEGGRQGTRRQGTLVQEGHRLLGRRARHGRRRVGRVRARLLSRRQGEPRVSRFHLRRCAQGTARIAQARGGDCSAGIGRVTSSFLIHHFDEVDLVEPVRHFIGKAEGSSDPPLRPARTAAGPSTLRQPLEEFVPEEGRYDAVFQWCVGHLHDEEFVSFFRRCAAGLKPEASSSSRRTMPRRIRAGHRRQS